MCIGDRYVHTCKHTSTPAKQAAINAGCVCPLKLGADVMVNTKCRGCLRKVNGAVARRVWKIWDAERKALSLLIFQKRAMGIAVEYEEDRLCRLDEKRAGELRRLGFARDDFE